MYFQAVMFSVDQWEILAESINLELFSAIWDSKF